MKNTATVGRPPSSKITNVEAIRQQNVEYFTGKTSWIEIKEKLKKAHNNTLKMSDEFSLELEGNDVYVIHSMGLRTLIEITLDVYKNMISPETLIEVTKEEILAIVTDPETKKPVELSLYPSPVRMSIIPEEE